MEVHFQSGTFNVGSGSVLAGGSPYSCSSVSPISQLCFPRATVQENNDVTLEVTHHQSLNVLLLSPHNSALHDRKLHRGMTTVSVGSLRYSLKLEIINPSIFRKKLGTLLDTFINFPIAETQGLTGLCWLMVSMGSVHDQLLLRRQQHGERT